jgi:hypothetical protein
MLPVNYAILYYHSIELLCYLIIIIMDRQAYLFYYFNSALLVWAIFRKVIRTIELSDYWPFGLLGFRTITPSDHWAFGLHCRWKSTCQDGLGPH